MNSFKKYYEKYNICNVIDYELLSLFEEEIKWNLRDELSDYEDDIKDKKNTTSQVTYDNIKYFLKIIKEKLFKSIIKEDFSFSFVSQSNLYNHINNLYFLRLEGDLPATTNLLLEKLFPVLKKYSLGGLNIVRSIIQLYCFKLAEASKTFMKMNSSLGVEKKDKNRLLDYLNNVSIDINKEIKYFAKKVGIINDLHKRGLSTRGSVDVLKNVVKVTDYLNHRIKKEYPNALPKLIVTSKYKKHDLDRFIELWNRLNHRTTDIRMLLDLAKNMPDDFYLTQPLLEKLQKAYPMGYAYNLNFKWRDKEDFLNCIKGWDVYPRLPPIMAIKVGKMDLIHKMSLKVLLGMENDPNEFNNDYDFLDGYNLTRIKYFTPEELEKNQENIYKAIDEIAKNPKSKTFIKASPFETESRFYHKSHLSKIFSNMYLNAIGPKNTYDLVKGFIDNGINAGAAIQTMNGVSIRHYENILKLFLKQSITDPQYALRLLLTFGNKWQEWLSNASKKINSSYHDATYWLPLKKTQGLSEFLLANLDKFNKQSLPTFSAIVANWDGIKDRSLKTFEEVLLYLTQTIYKNAKSTEFALESKKWNLPKDCYEEFEKHYLNGTKKPDFYPSINIEYEGYIGRFLKRSDPRGLYLGDYTNCCQHPTGAGEKCAIYGQVSYNSGFFVVEKNNTILSQSWCWYSNTGFTFDNVESKGLSPQQNEIVVKIYEKCAEILKLKHGVVNIGLGLGDLKIPDSWKGVKFVQLPKNYNSYTDARSQVTIDHDPDFKTPEIPVGTLPLNLEDKYNIECIARIVYPSGWQDVDYDELDAGVGLFIDIGKETEQMVGYALLSFAEKEILDLAVLPNFRKHSLVLLNKLLDMIPKGEMWKATARESTSYKLLKIQEKRGRIKLIEGDSEDKMGKDKMINVQLTIL